MEKIAGGYGGLWSALLAGALGLLVLFVYWESFLRYLRINMAFWQIPGPLAFPIIGNAYMFRGGPREYLRVVSECRRKYGPLFRLWIGMRANLLPCSGEMLQPVLSSSMHIRKSEDYRSLEPWLGTGLITSGGSKWHSRRKLLTGAFHGTLLEGYVESLDKEAGKMTSVLESHVPKDLPSEWSKPLDICQITKLSSLDAICETIMGYHINALDGDSNKEYIDAIDRVNKILHHRFITPWLFNDTIFCMTPIGKEFYRHVETIHKFTDRVIRERREELAACKKGSCLQKGESEVFSVQPKRKSFLDLLLDLSDNGKVLSDADIREEVDTFMFAGHDTTSAAMNWSLYALGHHPEAQTQILEEAELILGEDRKLTVSQINKMEYLDRFIKEVLRMYPPVPMIGRELESPVAINGHTFPPGTVISISTFMLHRDPTYFPDPNKFDPDRFLPSEMAVRHPFAYAPFSAGSRNCIGQKLALLELKIMLIRLIQALEVKSIIKEEDLILQGEIILNSPDGVPLFIRKRQ